jgi:outer membrane protein OmpA-like peptidoglycan-associated protein
MATAPSTAMHAPATHVTAAPAPAAAENDHPSLDFNITFATGSSELTPQAIKVLDTLGKALASNELSNSKFRIEGHTDTVGTPEANKDLSGRRATAVVSYLSQHYGIASTRLEAVGMGEEALLVPTGPGVPEQRNRRVHVVNVSG